MALIRAARQEARDAGLKMVLAQTVGLIVSTAIAIYFFGLWMGLFLLVIVGIPFYAVVVVWQLLDSWDERHDSDGPPSWWNGRRRQRPTCGRWFKDSRLFCRRDGTILDEDAVILELGGMTKLSDAEVASRWSSYRVSAADAHELRARYAGVIVERESSSWG